MGAPYVEGLVEVLPLLLFRLGTVRTASPPKSASWDPPITASWDVPVDLRVPFSFSRSLSFASASHFERASVRDKQTGVPLPSAFLPLENGGP